MTKTEEKTMEEEIRKILYGDEPSIPSPHNDTVNRLVALLASSQDSKADKTMDEIKKGVRIDLDNIIENLEGYNEADNKMPYEDVLFTQINAYFQAVLTKIQAQQDSFRRKVEEEVIGFDESTNGAFLSYEEKNRQAYRNGFRAEQRAKLKEIKI